MAFTIHGEMARGADGLTTIMNRHQTAMGKSIEKISTGLKINHAGDDSAGKAISEKMQTQIRALDQSESNTQSAGALLGIAETAVMSIIDVLTDMHTKAVEAAGASNDDDRALINYEIQTLKNEVLNEVSVRHNGRRLFDGTYGKVLETVGEMETYVGEYESNIKSLDNTELHISDMSWKVMSSDNPDEDRAMYFQVGPNTGDVITAHFMNMDKLFDGLTIDVSTQANAETTKASLDKVMNRVFYQLSEIGSLQQRLEFTSNNLQEVNADTQSALSVIQDADMAKEMSNFVKNNVLMQATQAMMAQANTTLNSFVSLIQPVQ